MRNTGASPTRAWGQLLLVALLCVGPGSAGSVRTAPSERKRSVEQGLELISAGQYAQAVARLEDAVQYYRARGDGLNQAAALVALGGALQALGQYCAAAQYLEEARPLAEATALPRLIMQVEAGLGVVYLHSRRLGPAEDLLRSALDRAQRLKDRRAEATILHDLGSVLIAATAPPDRAYQKDSRGVILLVTPVVAPRPAYREGLELYHRSAAIAEELGDPLFYLRILVNEGRVLELHGDPGAARQICREAWARLAALPDSRDTAFLRLSFGHLAAQLASELPEEREVLVREATEAYQMSRQAGRELPDDRTATYACGFLGELLLRGGRWDEAMRFAQDGLFLAQKSGNEEARLQWLWLVARILRAQGKNERAVAAYRTAARSLAFLRSDLSLWLSVQGPGRSFRETFGQVYYELADLLLQRAAQEASPEAVRADLLEARNAVEMLKSVEVEEYFFEDDCANLLRTKVQTVEASVQRSAVVYIIALTNRTELLLSLPSGLRRLSSPVESGRLMAEVRHWRSQLEKPDSEGYLGPAKSLWDWLVRPMEAVLQNEGVETLVFVPDAALRTVPMGALFDGRQFLIERFAVAVSPGLSLMEAGRTPLRDLNVLLCGVSKPVQDFPALDCVPLELTNITKSFRSRLLLDEAFSTSRFEQEMAQGEFTAIHLASHGEFGSDVGKTFILTYDGKLTLDRLEQLILPRLLSEKPIELLTLSACQTAAGDDRAALGLAGVAVKSGARSALATLWYISDEAAERIMSAFYSHLKQGGSISKAEALRRAQCELLRDPRFGHPSFWSPYLLIGNWR